MHIASCSKLMTAIAMTKLLNVKNIPFSTPIIKYLPDYWAKGPNINLITFANLMTRTSGFEFRHFVVRLRIHEKPCGGGRDSARTIPLPEYEFWALHSDFRDRRQHLGQSRKLAHSLNDTFWDYVTIECYRTYVHTNVFGPSGVIGPTLTRPDTDTLAYNFPVQGNGWNSEISSRCRVIWWRMSVDEMLNVMDTFRRHGTIMSTAPAQAMLDDGFGIDVRMETPLRHTL